MSVRRRPGWPNWNGSAWAAHAVADVAHPRRPDDPGRGQVEVPDAGEQPLTRTQDQRRDMQVQLVDQARR